MRIRQISFLISLLALALAGCNHKPSQEYALGAVLLTEDFTGVDAWEQYVDFNTGTNLQVTDGVYHVQTNDDGYIWGLNKQEHSDVVLEVSTTQSSTHRNNAYGVICRADTSNNGDGYYFLISGDGFYSIARGGGDEVIPLVGWAESATINDSQASNSLRAVCIGDYLALYVNGQFLAETRDTAYSYGYAGFAAAAFEEGDISVSFDNLTLWDATLSP